MTRYTLLILFSIIISFRSEAQFDTIWVKNNIRHCADSFTTALKIKDWDMYTRYSYPALVGSMGGTEAFKKFTSETFAQIPDSSWKKYEPGKVLQVIKTAGDMQAVVELQSVLHWDGNRITTTAYLIGESWDGGIFWRFFGNEGDREAAKVIKPDLSGLLILPVKKEKKEPLTAKPAKKN